MHCDDVLTEIRIRARLNSRHQAGRVVRAVMHALQSRVPDEAYRELARQVPVDGLDRPAGPSSQAGTVRQFVGDVAEQLHVSRPDAAFYCRITFEQLNAVCRGTTPAALAASLPADLGPLLSARTDDPATRHRDHLQRLGAAVTTLSLRNPDPTRWALAQR